MAIGMTCVSFNTSIAALYNSIGLQAPPPVLTLLYLHHLCYDGQLLFYPTFAIAVSC